MKFVPVRALSLAAIACALSGCAFRQPLTRMAMDYNVFVAKATDQQTALNILRARDREPLHFTSFTKVDGSVNLQATGEIGGTTLTKVPNPAGGSTVTGRTVAGPKLGVQVTSGTDFEVAINSTDDFWKGILTPIQPSMAVYYLQQGWNPELISYLFIDKIDYSIEIRNRGDNGTIVTLADGSKAIYPVYSVDNNPDQYARDEDKRSAMGVFASAVQCRPLAVESGPDAEKFVELTTVGDLADVAPDALGKVKIGPAAKPKTPPLVEPPLPPLRYQLEEGGQSADLTLAARTDPARCATWLDVIRPKIFAKVPNGYRVGGLPAESSQQAQRSAYKATRSDSRPSPKGPEAANNATFKGEGLCDADLLDQTKYTCNVIVSVTMRSVEGVIYYLGETLRPGNRAPKLLRGGCEVAALSTACYDIPIIAFKGEDEALDPRDRVLTEVDFGGGQYSVLSSGPNINERAGRTSEVITLIEQLLNLYRSSKDFPSTPYVRVAR